MNKQARILASTEKGSYASLLNALSPLFNSGTDKFTGFFKPLFPNSPRAAWLTEKSLAVAAAGALLAFGVRGAQHLNNIKGIRDKDNPAEDKDVDIKNQLGSTFTTNMSTEAGQLKRAATQVIQPDNTDIVNNTINMAVPIAALILGTGAAWKFTDSWADKRRNTMLSEAISDKTKKLNALMRTRAMLAKGTASQKQLNDAMRYLEGEDAFTKNAKEKGGVVSYLFNHHGDLTRQGLTAVGLLTLGMVGATAIGAYDFYSAADPDNIKYKATKKGLAEYARLKSLQTPVTIAPNDAKKFFKSIDAEARKPATPRMDTSFEPERHQELSVTL